MYCSRQKHFIGVQYTKIESDRRKVDIKRRQTSERQILEGGWLWMDVDGCGCVKAQRFDSLNRITESKQSGNLSAPAKGGSSASIPAYVIFQQFIMEEMR